jgi:hypothetical protein
LGGAYFERVSTRKTAERSLASRLAIDEPKQKSKETQPNQDDSYAVA